MTSQLCGAITNIILDPIMIFGLLGFPKMGVTGAAVATVIGQCVAGIVAGTCNHKYNHEVSLSFKGFRPDISLIGHIYAVGIPSIIMQSIGSIMTYSMNRILIEFSSTATAVFGVYFKLQSFFFMPVFGLNNGITPIIAYNYGAQQRKRMIRTIRISLTTAFCLTFIGFLCFEGIPQVLLGMFNASADMLKIGVPALRIIGIHYLIAWFCIIAGTVFQALGKAVFSMIVSIMRQLVVLIPTAYILSKIGGLHVVWWSFPIAEVISFIASMAFLIRIYKTIISKIPEGNCKLYIADMQKEAVKFFLERTLSLLLYLHFITVFQKIFPEIYFLFFVIHNINSHTYQNQCNQTSRIKCLAYFSKNQCR